MADSDTQEKVMVQDVSEEIMVQDVSETANGQLVQVGATLQETSRTGNSSCARIAHGASGIV